MPLKEQTYSVRCLFEWVQWSEKAKKHLYEERITVWRAPDFDTAIERAEAEAAAYAASICAQYLELAHGYRCDHLGESHGAELFSLLRESDLGPSDYLDAHFDTGHERQRG